MNDADSKYNEKMTNVKSLLEQIEQFLKQHANNQMNNKSWGFVGDLNYVETMLTQAVNQIS